MKRILLIYVNVAILIAISNYSYAQKANVIAKKIIHTVFTDTTASNKRSLRVYPTLGYSPETSFEFGFSTLMLFKARNKDENRLSELQGFTFVTLQRQYGIFLDNAIYGDKDKWFFLGKTKYQRFPLLYYGIGPDTKNDEPAIVDGTNLLLRQRVLRKVKGDFFIGPEIDYQLLYNTEFKQPENTQVEIPLGGGGSQNLGLGLALVYDDRHNVLNVRDGIFAELSYLDYRGTTGSDFDFNIINVDVRSYHPVNAKNVFAWQIYGNIMHGDVPFNQLALLGGDMMMRGYYQGRYRDKNMLTAQAEYRLLPFSFSKRWGAVAFAALGSVAPAVDKFSLNTIRPSAGGGLRFLLFPKKDIFLRLDFGFTQEGVNFYFYTGEAF